MENEVVSHTIGAAGGKELWSVWFCSHFWSQIWLHLGGKNLSLWRWSGNKIGIGSGIVSLKGKEVIKNPIIPNSPHFCSTSVSLLMNELPLSPGFPFRWPGILWDNFKFQENWNQYAASTRVFICREIFSWNPRISWMEGITQCHCRHPQIPPCPNAPGALLIRL